MDREVIHLLLESAITGGLAFAGWIGSRIVIKLGLLDKHATKLEVHETRLNGHDKDIVRLEAHHS